MDEGDKKGVRGVNLAMEMTLNQIEWKKQIHIADSKIL